MHRRNPVLTLNGFIACGLLLSSAAAAIDDSGPHVLLSFPSHLSRDAVSRASAAAFIGRKWEVQSFNEGRVVGYLNHRGIKATLELKILEDRIVYVCDCTKTKTGPAGRRTGRRSVRWTPVKWINNLRQDIQKSLLDSSYAAESGRQVDRSNRSSIRERLKVLEDLLSEHLVSQEEYDTKRAAILSEL